MLPDTSRRRSFTGGETSRKMDRPSLAVFNQSSFEFRTFQHFVKHLRRLSTFSPNIREWDSLCAR
jgi:hypothetical protein